MASGLSCFRGNSLRRFRLGRYRAKNFPSEALPVIRNFAVFSKSNNFPFGDENTEFSHSAEFWWNLQSSSISREIQDNATISMTVHPMLRMSPPLTMAFIKVNVFGMQAPPPQVFDKDYIASKIAASSDIPDPPTDALPLVPGGVELASAVSRNTNVLVSNVSSLVVPKITIDEATQMAEEMLSDVDFKALYDAANLAAMPSNMESAEVHAAAMLAELGFNPADTTPDGGLAPQVTDTSSFGEKRRKLAPQELWVNLQPDDTGEVSDCTGARYGAEPEGSGYFDEGAFATMMLNERHMSRSCFDQCFRAFKDSHALAAQVSPEDALLFADQVEEIYCLVNQIETGTWDAVFKSRLGDMQRELLSVNTCSPQTYCVLCIVPCAVPCVMMAMKTKETKLRELPEANFPKTSELRKIQDAYLDEEVVIDRYSRYYVDSLVYRMPPPAVPSNFEDSIPQVCAAAGVQSFTIDR